jgi:hypothetical protein
MIEELFWNLRGGLALGALDQVLHHAPQLANFAGDRHHHGAAGGGGLEQFLPGVRGRLSLRRRFPRDRAELGRLTC